LVNFDWIFGINKQAPSAFYFKITFQNDKKGSQSKQVNDEAFQMPQNKIKIFKIKFKVCQDVRTLYSPKLLTNISEIWQKGSAEPQG